MNRTAYHAARMNAANILRSLNCAKRALDKVTNLDQRATLTAQVEQLTVEYAEAKRIVRDLA
jgi:hypothetical protein